MRREREIKRRRRIQRNTSEGGRGEGKGGRVKK